MNKVFNPKPPNDWGLLSAILIALIMLVILLLYSFDITAQTATVPVNLKGTKTIAVSKIDSIYAQFQEYDRADDKLGLIDYLNNGVRVSIFDYPENILDRKLLNSDCGFCERNTDFNCGYTALWAAAQMNGLFADYFTVPLLNNKRFYTVYVGYKGGSVNSGTTSQINSYNRNECSVNICNHEFGHSQLRILNEQYSATWTLFYRQLHEHFADMTGTLSESYGDNKNLSVRYNKIALTTGGAYRTIKWRHFQQTGGYHNKSITQTWVFHALIWGETGGKVFDGKTYNYDIQSIGKQTAINLFERCAIRYGKNAQGYQPTTVFEWRDIVLQEAETLLPWQQQEVKEALYAVGLQQNKVCPLNTTYVTGYKATKFEAQKEFFVFNNALLINGAELRFTDCETF